jgi:predicted Holliday junction resolvase-like endonuclease
MFLELKEIFILIIWIIFWLFVWILIWKIIKYKTLKDERALSIKKSKSVILWEVYEKVLPFLPNFPYSPRDMTFVGKWIDYIIFDWLNEWNLRKIIFLEVKSGSSKLNINEKMIRDKIIENKVEYKEYKI